jgi:hypothetical protein
MTRRTNQIGFSQRVRLEWIEQTANLVLAGKDRPAVNDALQELLIDKVSVGGNAQRGNREKIVTILLKAWLTVPTELETLRVEGLDLFKRSPQHDHLAIHWGMVIAAYPFWSGVAVQVGRLLRLQGSAAAAQVQRRVREQYGERSQRLGHCYLILRCHPRRSSAPGTCSSCRMAALIESVSGLDSSTVLSSILPSSSGRFARTVSQRTPPIRASILRKATGSAASSVIRTESWLFFWARRVNSRPSIALRSRLIR